jgi:hypothetical protein
MKASSRRQLRVALWIVGLALLFAVYSSGLSRNPPGFYMDESCTAYNAYLLAHTGADESGAHFPIFFEVYRDSFTQYYHPIELYLLAIVFRFVPPSILLVRLFAAFWMFAACLLLGLLAYRISNRRIIGVIVTATALLTPWFFEVGRLAWDAHCVPSLTVLFLLAAYNAHGKGKWSWRDIAALVFALALLTYCYASGRVLGPLMAAGLIFFASTRQRAIAVAKTWLFYGITLGPIFLFSRQHPGALAKRFYEVTYVRPGMPWSDIASEFVRRYLEDQSLTGLLITGDVHPRHHVPGSGSVFFFATFVLAIIGLFIVIARLRRDPWWRFVLYGLAAAIVPGAISNWPFHALRLLAYPVFLLLLTVPALEWLVARGSHWADFAANIWPRVARLGILCTILTFTALEAYRFQTAFRRDGPKRLFEFDVPYKAAYDAATRQPSRPIYLEDGRWGPAYIHALWYAVLEKRPGSEFVHLKPGARPPAGAIVISSADNCQSCETLMRAYVYQVYKAL